MKKTPAGYRVALLGPLGEERALPDGARIRFYLSPPERSGPIRNAIDVEFDERTKTVELRVRDGRLVIVPSVANVVNVRQEVL